MGFNNELSGRIVLDIETVAAPDCAVLLDPVKPPANYKDPAKITAYCEEKLIERIATAALEADLCEVVAVGFSLDGVVDVTCRDEATETQMLKAFWKATEGRAIVGFNALSFDLPVLIRRSQLLGVKYPELNLDRYRTPHVDLMERLSFNGKLTYRSLSFYCRRFGLPLIEDQHSGADIANLVASLNWTAIADHCRADVEKTAALATRLGWLSPVEAAVL